MTTRRRDPYTEAQKARVADAHAMVMCFKAGDRIISEADSDEDVVLGDVGTVIDAPVGSLGILIAVEWVRHPGKRWEGGAAYFRIAPEA